MIHGRKRELRKILFCYEFRTWKLGQHGAQRFSGDGAGGSYVRSYEVTRRGPASSFTEYLISDYRTLEQFRGLERGNHDAVALGGCPFRELGALLPGSVKTLRFTVRAGRGVEALIFFARCEFNPAFLERAFPLAVDHAEEANPLRAPEATEIVRAYRCTGYRSTVPVFPQTRNDSQTAGL